MPRKHLGKPTTQVQKRTLQKFNPLYFQRKTISHKTGVSNPLKRAIPREESGSKRHRAL